MHFQRYFLLKSNYSHKFVPLSYFQRFFFHSDKSSVKIEDAVSDDNGIVYEDIEILDEFLDNNEGDNLNNNRLVQKRYRLSKLSTLYEILVKPQKRKPLLFQLNHIINSDTL